MGQKFENHTRHFGKYNSHAYDISFSKKICKILIFVNKPSNKNMILKKWITNEKDLKISIQTFSINRNLFHAPNIFVSYPFQVCTYFSSVEGKKTYYGDCVVCMGYSFLFYNPRIQNEKKFTKFVTIEISILNILQPFYFDDWDFLFIHLDIMWKN